MLAPRHPAVAPLPRAHRTALHLRSCAGRLDELIRLCRWLSEHGVSSLAQIGTRICDAYMAHRRYVLDEHGAVVGEQSPATRRAAAQVVVDLVNYGDLFTADRVPADLRPWGSAVSGRRRAWACTSPGPTRPLPATIGRCSVRRDDAGHAQPQS
ncbi:hypothetical protein ACWEKM_09150 [Streptomyces sp. NPDC004752]